MFNLSTLEDFPDVHADQRLPQLRPSWALIVEEALREMPPERAAFVAAAKAYDAGDEEPMEAWLAERVDGPIDPTLRGALEAWMWIEEEDEEENKIRRRGAVKVSIPAAFDWARYHRKRLDTPARRWYEDRGEEFFRNLKKTPGHELMRSLEAYGGEGVSEGVRLQRQKVQLKAEVKGAVMVAEAAGYYVGDSGRPMLRAVEKEVRDVNRLLRQTRKQIKDRDGLKRDAVISPYRVSEKGEEFDLFDVLTPGPKAKSLRTEEGEEFVLQGDTSLDPHGLAPYGEIEDALILNQLIRRSSLAPTELEVLDLSRSGLTPEEIAAKRGTERSTVYSQLRSIHKKLRAVS